MTLQRSGEVGWRRWPWLVVVLWLVPGPVPGPTEPPRSPAGADALAPPRAAFESARRELAAARAAPEARARLRGRLEATAALSRLRERRDLTPALRIELAQIAAGELSALGLHAEARGHLEAALSVASDGVERVGLTFELAHAHRREGASGPAAALYGAVARDGAALPDQREGAALWAGRLAFEVG
ncbi:MAG: hypothetical protein AAFZ65_12645, partial [Planctomycetota bacterium]